MDAFLSSLSGVFSKLQNQTAGKPNSSLHKSAKPVARSIALAALVSCTVSCAPRNTALDLSDARFSPEPNTFTEGQRILVDATGNKFGVELTEQKNSNTLVVSFPKGEVPKYTTERLSNPERLVIDINGVTIPANRTFDTKDAGVIEKVRLGSHPTKTRIVLDLPADQKVDYKIQKSKSLESGANTLNLVINTKAEALVAKATENTIASEKSEVALNAKNSEDAKERTIAELPTSPLAKKILFDSEPSAEDKLQDAPALKKSESVKEKELLKADKAELALNSIMASPQVEDESALTNKRPLLQTIELQALSSTENQLRVKGTLLDSAQLQKTAPSEYVLKIPQGQLAESAAATILAPANAGVIRSVRPVARGKDVWLRIFSQPNVSLDAKTTAGSIIVSAEAAAPVVARSARAQASIEKLASAKAESTDSEVSALLGDQPKYTGRLISLDLQDTDIDNALRIIAEVSNLNIIASDDVQGKITLRLIDVPWDQALDVILKTNGLDKVQEGNVVRIAPVEKLRSEREGLKQARVAEEELEPLQVRYVRISYAKAAELKALVESVISDRGSVAYDERTNQLIIKDIRKGIVNVAELIAKLDLRTPQVLLETQIVEASRTLLRELGSEFGFTMVQSPATGNATGYNFPNSISLGGSVSGGSSTGSSFPAAIGTSGGSAVSLLLDSADATRSVSARLSALENEGRARIISRPAVATTNNKQAVIKSVEKIRIKTPQGGLSVATGQGAQASGSTSVATETVEIGIVLEVTPQASPDYYVLLDINAKSSTLGTTVVDGIPSEVERSATSSVLVSSGQTFAMGGIYKIRDNESLTGVPFLKDIPVLGALFRRSKIDNSDEELLFFITPRVIEGSFDDAAMKM